MEKLSIPLTIIFKQEDEGYVVYAKQIPEVLSEGQTKDVAIQNLLNAIRNRFMELGKIDIPQFGIVREISLHPNFN